MSDTPVDMAKVTQMLDAGWVVSIERGGMGGYVARGEHPKLSVWARAKSGVLKQLIASGWTSEEAEDLAEIDFEEDGVIDTEDFTPEQALTRLAYKVHGEIIGGTEEQGND